MAIILAYIETESIPSHRFAPLPVSTPQKTYTKIHSNWKIATEPHHDDSITTGKPPRILPSTGWSFEPGVEQRGPVIITRPPGHKVIVTEPEGLDPITLFNTQYNSRRSSSVSSGLSFQPTPREQQQRGKRKVSFAKWQDIIPPVCTDLVLYREFGPDSYLSYTAASGGGRRVRGFDWGRLWIAALAVAYLGLVLLGNSIGSSDEDMGEEFYI